MWQLENSKCENLNCDDTPIVTKLIKKMLHNSINHIVTKCKKIIVWPLKKSNCDKTQQLNLWWNSKTKILTTQINMWPNSSTQTVTTQKLKLWQNSETQILTTQKLKLWRNPKLKLWKKTIKDNCDKLDGSNSEMF